MNDEIIENYTITPELLTQTRENRKWNFAHFKITTAWRSTDKASWQLAANAARQAGRRKGMRFACKWYEDRNFGVVVRIE